MKIRNMKGSAIFTNSVYVKNEYLAMQLKFFEVSEEKSAWLWELVKKEFYYDLRDSFFMRFGSAEKSVKESFLEEFFMKKREQNDIWVEGVYKDARFGNMRSFAGAENFFDKKYDMYDEFYGPEYQQYRLKDRDDFSDEEEFLEHIRKVMRKDGIPLTQVCVWPDISWTFHTEKRNGKDEYQGYIQWSLAGESVGCFYEETLKELRNVFDNICGKLENVIGNIYLSSKRHALEGPPFAELIREGIFKAYGDFPTNIFLLGGVEWLNYVPYSLMRRDRDNRKNINDSKVIVETHSKGVCYIINKPIDEVTIEDRKYMRQYYLDNYLMKGRTVIDEEAGSDSDIRDEGGAAAFFDEELQLRIEENADGTVIYGVEYIPSYFGKRVKSREEIG